MIANLRPAIVSMALFTALLGLAYPLGVTGLAQALFPVQAGGSLIRNASGEIVGSRWIGQNFKDEAHLRPRPSAAGKDGYDASGSSGSNLGPLNEDLAARLKTDAEALRTESKAPIPVDAVTTSASGLDPHVSPANAARQVPRIAAARKVPAAEVQAVIAANTEGSTFGLLGEPRVNVLAVNLALDARWPRAQR
ncbi:Potassium-transporting ATPase KdpC subunit [Bosea sp. 62]|uniref:potassium-transporting ATPase subunit KdpC n=1 Tax=unclassified Bosea (in: a-proteobacteria) TaxID=2653178 RepID=UPI001254F364|nr:MULTISPECIES: potassium-transporting ATPase subunit KdpC [unclassified Bosea (in: a-proteobacteria)]CAD5259045.1 Potassium-transporting ATPase KdpC subunit [Bosea sp. 46]CAD5263462.1 Potassium-transporting ATPase KdpC subunit [Bosea sp. 21B]CAD5276819.1 Potassium-transporting ATPase KdpC subunit [Bosea sp. 7B]VVT58992.1 Potassium-transporting ATPase KdpC subunit [Bosea sp. EC-HK365B]VXB64718.1 Potassium-transporting ATPase KdpC subunit [Bosea sp. 29B]